MANELGSRVAVVHGCFSERGYSILSGLAATKVSRFKRAAGRN